MLERASSTALMIDLHCPSGNPKILVSRSTVPRTTESHLGLLYSASINTNPPRCPGFRSCPSVPVGKKKAFMSSTNVHYHERHVIRSGPRPPTSDAVENALLHLLGWQSRCVSHDFSNTVDTEHLSSGIKNLGDPVCVQDNAVIWLERDLLASIGTHGIGARTENHASGLEHQGILPTTRQHRWRMAGAGENHTAAARVDAGSHRRYKHSRTGEVFDQEAVQLTKHIDERHGPAQMCGGLRVNPVRK